MNTSHEHIYYLDPWFIAREYEARTNTSLPSTIRRSSSSLFQGSAVFAKAQGGNQESVEFRQTPEKAFWEISADLEDFPEIEVNSDTKFPPVYWVTGILCLYGQKHSRQVTGEPKELLDDVWAFSILISGKRNAYIRLLTDDAHFRYNIQQLLQHPLTLGSHFRPRVRALLKSHGNLHSDHCFLATPLVIIVSDEGGPTSS